MQNIENQKHAAHYMQAVAHLLVGESGKHRALNNRLAIMFGEPVGGPTLVHWVDWSHRNDRPILYCFYDPETPNLPMFTLVDGRDGQGLIFMRCFPWLRSENAGAILIPDGFKSGSYVVDDKLSLKHLKRAPAPSYRGAEAGLVRAYDRLFDILAHQRDEDLEFPTPVKLEQRAA